MAEDLPRYRPGEAQLSAEALNRTAEVAERADGGLGVPGATRLRNASGDLSVFHTDDSMWIRLLTNAAGGLCGGAYNWEEVVWDPAVCNWVTMSGGRSGSAFDLPAFEANGSVTVSIGRVVRAWFAPDGLSVQFEYCC